MTREIAVNIRGDEEWAYYSRHPKEDPEINQSRRCRPRLNHEYDQNEGGI